MSKPDLPIAKDVSVYIPDLTHGVPGSTMRIWEYREKVDKDWKPGPDYPGIKAEPLPTRRSNMAIQAIHETFKLKVGTRANGDYNSLPTKNPVVQVVGRPDSLDMREYQTRKSLNAEYKDGQQIAPYRVVDIPFDEQTTYESASSMFLNTVHACFSRHHPLGIRPEALMWMVLHEVGVTVKQNAEAYRELFTDSPEKKLIDVQVNNLDIHDFDQLEVWAEGIKRLHQGLRGQMPSGLMEHLLPPISTHDFHSETASMVAVLDAASPYYDYLGRTDCCIPSIRLFGTGEDYDRVLRACGQLAEVFTPHLGDYFAYLLPVLREIADTASGRMEPDNGFWSSIYKHYSGSGNDHADGWITAFVNYRFVDGRFVKKGQELFDWRASLSDDRRPRYGRGIDRSEIPNHLSCVPFTWNYAKNHADSSEGEFAGRNFKLDNQGNGANFDCRLVGGFLAVDDIDGYATPALSYAVIRGDELKTKVNEDGSWTVQAEGQTQVTANKRSVYAALNPDGRTEVYASNPK